MKFDIHIYHHLGAEDSAVLSHITKLLLPVSAKLDGISEKLNLIMTKQEKIDALTEQVQQNTAGVKEAISAEIKEVKAAIDDQSIDTTKLEAALAENQGLAKLVNDIYTASGETPPIVVDPTLPAEETPEVPVDPAPAEETLPAEETAPAENTPTDELPAPSDNQTEDNNQPFDPNPTEEKSEGWDDQERTPVPSL